MTIDLDELERLEKERKEREEREVWDRYFAAQSEYAKTTGWSAIIIPEAASRADAMLEERRRRWP